MISVLSSLSKQPAISRKNRFPGLVSLTGSLFWVFIGRYIAITRWAIHRFDHQAQDLSHTRVASWPRNDRCFVEHLPVGVRVLLATRQEGY
jgi:hypothetical protein